MAPAAAPATARATVADGATTEVGGCSTSGGSAGLFSFLLIGLAAFIRRRRV